jgi:hypothetical protein
MRTVQTFRVLLTFRFFLQPASFQKGMRELYPCPNMWLAVPARCQMRCRGPAPRARRCENVLKQRICVIEHAQQHMKAVLNSIFQHRKSSNLQPS